MRIKKLEALFLGIVLTVYPIHSALAQKEDAAGQHQDTEQTENTDPQDESDSDKPAETDGQPVTGDPLAVPATDALANQKSDTKSAGPKAEETAPPTEQSASSGEQETSAANAIESQEGASADKVSTREKTKTGEALGSEPSYMDWSLDELLSVEVVSATKSKTSLREAPAIIDVVLAKDLAVWGYQSVGEALKYILGFYLIDDHILYNAAVRGVPGGLAGESGTIKVMIDGKSTSFKATSGNWLGPELIPISAIDHIEIIRGPASALYGADAFLGIVNIVTKKGTDLNGADMGGKIGYSFAEKNVNLNGSYDITAGARKEWFEAFVSAGRSREDRSGLKIPETSPAPYVSSYSDVESGAANLVLDSKVVFLKVDFHLGEHTVLGAFGYLSIIDRGGEFSHWAQMTDGLDAYGRHRSTHISLYKEMAGIDLKSDIKENLTLSVGARYLTGGPTDRDRIEIDSETYYIKRLMDYHGTEATAELLWSPLDWLSFLTGVEVGYFRQQLPSALRVFNFDTADYQAGEIQKEVSTRQGEKDFLNLGGLLQAVVTPIEKYLTLTGGFRYDHNSIYDSQYSGRFAVVSNPVKDLFIKALYGNAFKAPSPQLLYAVPYRPGDIIGNAELKPQRIHTVELQIGYSFFKYFTATTGGSYNYLIDYAQFSQLGLNLVAVNVAQASSTTWETELKADYLDKIGGFTNLEFVWTRLNLGTDDYMADLVGLKGVIYPSYIWRSGLFGKIPKIPLRLSLQIMYVGPRRADEMNILENGANYVLDPYVMLDATLSTVGLKFIKEYETAIAVIGRNLVNARGPDPGYSGIDYPPAPLTIFLQLRQEL